MRFCHKSRIAEAIEGKMVALVGSAPSVLENKLEFIDSHEVVVRVNNYKLGHAQGFRCDVHYSFYGKSIRKQSNELTKDGVKLCICKLPNSKPLQSDWHDKMKKPNGVDYRYIYQDRKYWWFCDTVIPEDKTFLDKFELLGKHQPTSGFAAILDILEGNPKSLYLTGFDFFSSGMHNVNEKWRPGHLDDPICHRPDLELKWLAENQSKYPMTFDKTLARMVSEKTESENG